MNSQEQENRKKVGATIPEHQHHHLVVVLARMMRQNLTTTTYHTEVPAKTRREPDARLRTTSHADPESRMV